MKKTYFFAIALMATAIAVAVVSCKKETASTLLNNQPQTSKTFYPEGVDDMNAYLKDFKQKMQTVTRDNEETLSLEEAAWYLSSVANYDFGHVNVEFTDLYYDTLFYHVNISNGQVELSDLNAVYERAANDIDNLYQNLNLENKHIRFVGSSITEDGEIIISLIFSHTVFDHLWYFTDPFYYDTICYYYFSEDSLYIWNQLGASELERVINSIEGRNYMMPGEEPNNRMFLVYVRDTIFDFRTSIDTYPTSFINNSRIFAIFNDSFATPALSMEELCYCLDSYLGLPFEHEPNYPLVTERPVHWIVEGKKDLFFGDRWPTFYHKITVKIGQFVTVGDY